jgi:hypothetical protein
LPRLPIPISFLPSFHPVNPLMPKPIHAVAAIALGGAFVLAAVAARAQDAADRTLLASFCDAANIKGDTCTHAKGYPASGKRNCDVKLLKDRFGGRFVASGNPLLVVNYDSGCEARANDDGGSAVFELVKGTYSFVGFQPGMRVNDCITVPRNEKQDSLVCLTGHMGQGYLEGGVAQMLFARDYGKGVSIKYDFLLKAVDSTGAYGSNVVTCRKKPPRYFELSKLAAGPRKETVAFDASWADADIFKTACGKGFPKPKEVLGTLAKGDAWVPPGFEKKGRVIIDLATRKVLPPG